MHESAELRRIFFDLAKQNALRSLGEAGLLVGTVMKFVYLLRSRSDPERRYVGLTRDFETRLSDHNQGKSPHTRKYLPWDPVVVIQFSDDQRAEAFERYLKHGSGHAFAKRHFW